MNFDFQSQPLTSLRPGATARVTGVHGGRGMVIRLAHMGIRPGATVRLVNRGPWRGPLLVEVDGMRVALGRGVARHVLVRPVA
ncbi:MAG: FeoA family protein [Candidatus Bipolaricaulaceae bacterium]